MQTLPYLQVVSRKIVFVEIGIVFVQILFEREQCRFAVFQYISSFSGSFGGP